MSNRKKLKELEFEFEPKLIQMLNFEKSSSEQEGEPVGFEPTLS